MFHSNNDKVFEVSNRANKTILNLSKNNKSRKSILVPNIKAIEELIFLTSNAKKRFNYLQLVFIKASII